MQYGELCFKFPVLANGFNPGAALYNVFVAYCSVGLPSRHEDMASNQFAKLCKDSGLINGKTVTKAAVDIIFARCAPSASCAACLPVCLPACLVATACHTHACSAPIPAVGACGAHGWR